MTHTRARLQERYTGEKKNITVKYKISGGMNLYDLLIKNAMIIDGTGRKRYKGDVAVSGDSIAAVGDLQHATAQRVIDAKGRVLAPGFIDTHSHSDAIYLVNPTADSKVRQGVTTEVTGQCGNQSAPLYGEAKAVAAKLARQYGVDADWESYAEFCKRLEKHGLALNTAPLLGHGTVRACVIGYDNRPPTDEELERMQHIVEQAMQEGAWGISTGLIYPPGSYSEIPELAACTSAAAKHGGIYATHMRSEMDTILESLEEAMEIGRRSGATVLISHHKVTGKQNWGLVEKTCAMMDEYRKTTGKIYCDVYPYTAGSTSLTSLIPSWAHDGGVPKLLERLADPKTRELIKQQMQTGCEGWERLTAAGYENILVTFVESEKNKYAEGKSISQIAEIREAEDPRDVVIDLLLEEDGNAGMVLFMMCEEDVADVVKYPYAAIGSDASAISPEGPTGRGKPHPRAYGTFPRVLGKYVREEKHLSLEEAVRKMTSLSAEIVGLCKRGTIAPGLVADLVVFDPDSVRDCATFEQPHSFPVGIDWVIVNGVPVLEEGVQNDLLPGRVLRKQEEC